MKKIAAVLMILAAAAASGAEKKTLTAGELTEKHVGQMKNSPYSIVLYCSNIVYVRKGKEVSMPVFRGTLEDVSYLELDKYCHEKKLLKKNIAISGIDVPCRTGEVKKTFREFLDFYKKNMPGNFDIENPSEFNLSGNDVSYYYNFTVNGIPCSFEFSIKVDLKCIDLCGPVESPYDLIPVDDGSQNCFYYNF